MTCTEIVNLIGLLLNIIGSIVLSISLSKYLTSIHGALAIHDMQLDVLIKQKDRILTGDIGNLLKVGVKSSLLRTRIGLVLIVCGFVLQLMPYILILCRHSIENGK